MDPRLLRHYEAELSYLRDMGAEFAAEFPKIAARLDIANTEVADPYVERLLEGFAFLAARIQLKMEFGIPDLHAITVADGLPALRRAHALHGDRAPHGR